MIMPYNVLLAGFDDLLATCISALELTQSGSSSIYRLGLADRIQSDDFLHSVCAKIQVLRQEKNAESIQREVISRLHMVHGGLQDTFPAKENFRAERVWYFIPTQRNFKRRGRDSFGQLLAALPQLAVREFNLVVTAYPPECGHAQDNPSWNPEEAVAEQCRVQNIGFRVFRTSLVVGEGPVLYDGHDFLHFLSVLYDLKCEIQDRIPEYFDFKALRCSAPHAAALNLIRAEQAAELMLRITQQEGTLNRSYDIASSQNTSYIEICARIGSAYNLSLLVTEDEQTLNAIDRLFQERIGIFHKHLESPPNFAWQKAYQVAGLDKRGGMMDEAAQSELFQSVHKLQSVARSVRHERLVALPHRLDHNKISKNGFDLKYLTGGSEGAPIVILNALGQGLVYWYGLIDILLQRHRIVIWEPRGTASPPQPFGLQEQVEDIKAVLQREGITTCHLVGWCTGPKAAVEFYLHSPTVVQSMVFLNSQFKCRSTPRELITHYEHNIESLFRVLEKNPTMASSVASSLKTNLSGGKVNLLQNDSQKLAIEVLSAINQKLKAHVLAPYQSEATTLNYAYQVLDFWSHDTLEKAAQVQVPILMVATEHDKIAAPSMSKAALKNFPRASHVEVRGATHYCLYDSPKLVAELIEEFFDTLGTTT
jgi:pimeloyl-ACP methyl ester carboxylesterase